MKRWDDQVETRIRIQQMDGLISKSLNARSMANALNLLDAKMLIAQFDHRPQGNPRIVLYTLHHIWVATLYGQLPEKL